MMPTSNGVVWLASEHEGASSWDNNEEENTCKDLGINPPPYSVSNFKSMLENEWFVSNSVNNSHSFLGNNHPEFTSNNLLLPSMDSSSSCSPSQAFTLDPSQSHSQFFGSKSSFSSLLNLPYDSSFDLGCDSSFMTNCEPSVLMSCNGLISVPNREPGSTSDFASTHLVQTSDDMDNNSVAVGFNGVEFDGFDGPSLGNANMIKMLGPPQVLPTVGEQKQHTLFEKRAALHQGADMGNLGKFEDLVKKRKRNTNEDGDEFDEGSIDISGSFNYDSDEFENKNVNNNYSGGCEIWDNSNANESVAAGEKGKKKGLPAKNLMAERRRRKKLNDRLYMLRSIVPKISKMDRASILGDAVDYLKELLQRINDLNSELEATPTGSLSTPTSSFQPLTPTPVTLPYHVKEEIHSGSLPSPKNTSARVEVRAREGRAVNIHMFCARRPGLLLSTMRALDSLELDIQQAVVSCFNGFALDVFRAEQCSENKDVLPEQIKAVLLDSVGFHGAM